MPTRKDTQQTGGRRQAGRQGAGREAVRRGPAQKKAAHSTRAHHRPSATDIAKALKGIHYPMSKSEIVAFAREHDADEAVVHVLERIPKRVYGNMADVEKGVAKVHE